MHVRRRLKLIAAAAAVGLCSAAFASHALSSTGSAGPRWTSELVPAVGSHPYEEASLQENACAPKSAWCASVGTAHDRSLRSHILVLVSNGAMWHSFLVPLPKGAIAVNSVQLDAMECPSVDRCVAVGSFRNSRNDDQGLIISDVGGTWFASVSPTQGEISGSWVESLNLLSCPTWGHCTAAGTYHIPNDSAKHPFFLAQSGSTWSLSSLALPLNVSSSAPVIGKLGALFCRAASDCVAAGAFGGAGAFVETETNGTWTAIHAPRPTSVTSGITSFSDAACPATNRCFITANYGTRAYGSLHGMILSETSGGWTAEKVPLPVVAPWSLVSKLSCQTLSVCVVGGGYGPTPSIGYSYIAKSGTARYRAVLLQLQGREWKVRYTSGPSLGPLSPSSLICGVANQCAGVYGGVLGFGGRMQALASLITSRSYNFPIIHSLACTSSVCFAVGQNFSKNQSTPLVATSKGAAWERAKVPLPKNSGVPSPVEINQIACSRGGWCEGLGTIGIHGDDASPIAAATFSKGKWRATNLSLPHFPRAQITALACRGVDDCVAVGHFAAAGSSAGMLVQLRNHTWTAVRAPLPVGGKDSNIQLTGISCSSVGACFAVGSYTTRSHLQRGAFLSENQGHWTATVAPLPTVSPAWGKPIYIDGISCGGNGSCVAIGGYDSSDNGNSEGSLIWSRAGNRWTAINPPPAPSARYANLASLLLTSLSCPDMAVTSCAITGNFYTGEGLQHILLLHGYGRSWSMTEIPVDRKTFPFAMNVMPQAVDCVTASFCMAIANEQPRKNQRQYTLVGLRYTGGTWQTRQLPVPNDRALDSLDGVACLSIHSCAAVGRAILTYSNRKWFASRPPVPAAGLTLRDLTTVAAAGPRFVALGVTGGGDLYSLHGLLEQTESLPPPISKPSR